MTKWSKLAARATAAGALASGRSVPSEMTFCTYNPLHAIRGRLAEISYEMRNCAIVGMPGTQRFADIVEGEQARWTMRRAPKHFCIDVGTRKGGNKSEGVTIMFAYKFFSPLHIMDIQVPDVDSGFACRNVFVRVCNGRLDFSVCCPYFPVGRQSAGKDRARYIQMVSSMCNWTCAKMLATPARSLQLICTDLNHVTGLVKDEGGSMIPIHTFSKAVGMCQPDIEGSAACLFRNILERLSMCMINTCFNAGCTYHGAHSQTRIDFLCLPYNMLNDVTFCGTVKRVAAKLQVVNVHGIRDHIPLIVKMQFGFMSDGDFQQILFNWDRDRIMEHLRF